MYATNNRKFATFMVVDMSTIINVANFLLLVAYIETNNRKFATFMVVDMSTIASKI